MVVILPRQLPCQSNQSSSHLYQGRNLAQDRHVAWHCVHLRDADSDSDSDSGRGTDDADGWARFPCFRRHRRIAVDRTTLPVGSTPVGLQHGLDGDASALEVDAHDYLRFLFVGMQGERQTAEIFERPILEQTEQRHAAVWVE